mmetsp:Transcript_17196/g.25964  ORF Transcript_17196/g.25964 Transcript_17196/m.25964 type:complete len:342 (+) Transcript_17196:161-1186(+)
MRRFFSAAQTASKEVASRTDQHHRHYLCAAAPPSLRRQILDVGLSLTFVLLLICAAVKADVASAMATPNGFVAPLMRYEVPDQGANVEVEEKDEEGGDEELPHHHRLQVRVGEGEEDQDGLLQLERQMLGEPPVESRFTCLAPSNTSTFVASDYEQLSDGLCKLDVPRRKEFPTEARVCARMCTADWKCYGFVVSQAEDCIHYYEKFLIPGGPDINGAYCHKQVNRTHTNGSKYMAYSGLGQGLCKMVPRLPEYDLCHNETEATCKTLCDSKIDCFGYSHIPEEGFCLLYSELDLRNGTQSYNGAKCMKKKWQAPDNITYWSETPFNAPPPPLPRSLPTPV